jgi:voltage-gated potassium channel
MLMGTVLYGVIGYMILIDGANVIDGLYWTTLTLGGVGFRDTEPVGTAAEVFSISLIVLLLASVAAIAAIATDLAGSGELAARRREKRRRSMTEALDDHYIICGYGRVGRAVAEQLSEEGARFLVVDIDPRDVDELDADEIAYIVGDPSHEAILLEAGIHRARALVCAVDSDAVNVFITLTARGLRPDIMIVARATERESIAKLERAGAGAVVSPYSLSGRAMALRALEHGPPEP